MKKNPILERIRENRSIKARIIVRIAFFKADIKYYFKKIFKRGVE